LNSEHCYSNLKTKISILKIIIAILKIATGNHFIYIYIILILKHFESKNCYFNFWKTFSEFFVEFFKFEKTNWIWKLKFPFWIFTFNFLKISLKLYFNSENYYFNSFKNYLNLKFDVWIWNLLLQFLKKKLNLFKFLFKLKNLIWSKVWYLNSKLLIWFWQLIFQFGGFKFKF
jgi:hypothetical protein